MKWSVLDFCLLWTPSLYCEWLSIFLPLREQRSSDICYLTMREVKHIRCPVEANDGFVYDAVNLQRWLSICVENGREPSVIPQKPITHISPIRVCSIRSKFDWYVTCVREFVKLVCAIVTRCCPPMRDRECSRTVREVSVQTEQTGILPDHSESTITEANIRHSAPCDKNFHTSFEWLPRKFRGPITLSGFST